MRKEIISIDWGFMGDDTTTIIAEHSNSEQVHLKAKYNLTEEDLCKAVALYAKLKSIPLRTIETLEVGDYMEFMCSKSNFKNVFDIKMLVTSKFDLEHVKGTFKEHKCYDIQIIPHQALEILKELLK